jgi:exodeoxyribonuclease V alpha subunit
MKPQPEAANQEVLAGLIERVTYHNAENGFCVLRAKARGHRDVVTVVGHAATIAAGEWITASGEWVNDRTHGQQFKARFLRTSPPTSADGIEKYLSSGMIRGVGPVYAKKLVRAFGEKVFDIIETTPDRLHEVDGIGPVRAASILAAWVELGGSCVSHFGDFRSWKETLSVRYETLVFSSADKLLRVPCPGLPSPGYPQPRAIEVAAPANRQ